MNSTTRLFQIAIIPLFILIMSHSFAQGTLQGTVRDKKNGETIPGANIVLKGTMTGTASNFEGHYQMQGIRPGTYTVVCSFISYKTIEIQDVKIEAGKSITMDFTLEQDIGTLIGFRVAAKRVLNTDVSIIGTLKTSDLVLSGISAEQIKRSSDGDAAQVVKRVPGVTIAGNRFIVIRGLSERYNAVMLHDVYAPSMEADVRSFSFDVVPSGLIDRILIFKSPSAELPGDFAGGVVKIYTISIPDENSVNASYSTTYRAGTTFKDFQSASKSSLYWTGFNDGRYNLPADFPNDIRKIDHDPAEVDKHGKSLINSWIPVKSQALPDQSLTLTINRKFKLGKKQAGSITSFSYNNSKSTYNIDRRDFNAYDLDKKVKSVIYDFDDLNYRQNIRFGILSNWSLSLNPKHSIDFKNLFNQLSSSEYIHRSGPMYEFNYNANTHSFYQIYRGIYTGQLTGNHKFSEQSSLDWILSYGFSYRDEPDYRRYRSDLDTITGESTLYVPFGSAQTYFMGRFYSEMKEHNVTSAANYKYKIKLKNSPIKPVFSAGYFFEFKDRSFVSRNIGYVRSSILSFDNGLLDVGIDSLFHPDNINQTTGIRIDEQSNPSDSYTARANLIAGYSSIQIPFSKRITANVGVRIENYLQKLNSFTLTNDPINVEIPELSLLPSGNLTYNVNNQMLFRFAYGKTLNKPEFRELAPFGFYDFNYNLVRKGSDSIKMATVHNFDLRWELYPTPREMITIGVFYKRFNNPIENSFVPGGGSGGIKTFTYANADAANNRGIEIEVRKSLDGMTRFKQINNLSILFNAALVESHVDLGNASLGQGIDTRAMYGQSPFIVNAGLFYQNAVQGIFASAQYNIIGKRIFIIGYDDYPDIYEMPRHLLDFTVSKTFGSRIEVKLNLGNVLNQDFMLMQDANRDGTFDAEADHVLQQYTPGRTIGCSVSYKF